jgi:uncharacterized membrane protein
MQWFVGLHIRGRMVRRMVRRMVELFGVILVWVILGDVLKKGAEVEKNEFVSVEKRISVNGLKKMSS